MVSLAPPGWQPRGERRCPVRGGCRFAGKGAGGLGGPWRSSGLPVGSGRGGRRATVGESLAAAGVGASSGAEQAGGSAPTARAEFRHARRQGGHPDRPAAGDRGQDLRPARQPASGHDLGAPLKALGHGPQRALQRTAAGAPGGFRELLGADIALVRQPSSASHAILEGRHVSGHRGPADEGSAARRPRPQGRIDTVGLGAQAQRCGPVSGLGGVDPDRGATGRGPDLAPLAVAAPAGLAGDPLDALPQQPPAPGAATELGVGAAPGVPRGVDLNVAGESAAIHAGRYAQPPQLVRGCRNCPGHRSTRRGTLSTTVSRPARDSRQLKAPIQFRCSARLVGMAGGSLGNRPEQQQGMLTSPS